MKQITVNTEQGLYVIPCGKGFTCQGFTNADEEARAVAAWLGRPDIVPSAPLGTVEHYNQCQEVLKAGFDHYNKTRERCPAGLTPQLNGLEGKRIEVVDCYGEKRRFIVGRSTGWMPCHLEISKRNSNSGPAVSGAPFISIRVV